jgi:hypothetical protein
MLKLGEYFGTRLVLSSMKNARTSDPWTMITAQLEPTPMLPTPVIRAPMVPGLWIFINSLLGHFIPYCNVFLPFLVPEFFVPGSDCLSLDGIFALKLFYPELLFTNKYKIYVFNWYVLMCYIMLSKGSLPPTPTLSPFLLLLLSMPPSLYPRNSSHFLPVPLRLALPSLADRQHFLLLTLMDLARVDTKFRDMKFREILHQEFILYFAK